VKRRVDVEEVLARVELEYKLKGGRTEVQEKLKAVQVGCGARAQAHIAAMQECGAIELVALCDQDETKLTATGEKFGIGQRYKNMSEMIRALKPEFVNIVTPPNIRLGIVEEAIEAGAPAILLEKPLSLTLQEAQRLLELSKDRLIAVNTQYQWMPHWKRFWKLLEQKTLGEVRIIRASTRCHVLEQGPHILDLALKAARSSKLPNPELLLAATHGTEDYCGITVPADLSATIGLGEARLFLNAGPSAPAVPGETVIWYQQQVDVIGDAGRLWVSLNQGWQLWTKEGLETGATVWANNDGEAQRALFVELRDVLKTDTWRTFPTGLEAAIPAIKLAFDCIEKKD
jgi:predicted dehydrogenase